MSPFEHGEVFVLDDGGEADLDMGNYERFLDITLTADHNITTGKVYSAVLARERRGDYLGKTVQVVPHVTEEIQSWIERVAKIPVDGEDGEPDVCLIEVGGTVGDIESSVFLEALRQFQWRVGRDHFCLVHVSLVPVLGSVGEQKTKPTQHSTKEVMSLGLNPDMIVCRSAEKLQESTRQKISIFTHVAPENVLSVHDVSNIYHVPLILEEQNFHSIVRARLGLGELGMSLQPDLSSWKAELAVAVDECDKSGETVTIALVGKYTGLSDAYLSVLKSLKHSAIEARRALNVVWVDASELQAETETTDKAAFDKAWAALKESDGVVVPGGFGVRGVEGKIAAARYCRTNGKPYLGVCLGMQCIVIEFARSVCDIKGAHSEEFDENAAVKVIKYMPEIDKANMGGTMRLGARLTVLHPLPEGEGTSLASALYKGEPGIMERHRHRYEVNPDYVDQIEKAGLRFTGKDESNERMEIVELPRSQHPFYLGCQYHPEFKSRPQNPSPPFLGLVLAAIGQFDQIDDRMETICVRNGGKVVGMLSPNAKARSKATVFFNDTANGGGGGAAGAAAAAAASPTKKRRLVA